MLNGAAGEGKAPSSHMQRVRMGILFHLAIEMDGLSLPRLPVIQPKNCSYLKGWYNVNRYLLASLQELLFFKTNTYTHVYTSVT